MRDIQNETGRISIRRTLRDKETEKQTAKSRMDRTRTKGSAPATLQLYLSAEQARYHSGGDRNLNQASLSPHGLLRLQRIHGNKYICRMLQKTALEAGQSDVTQGVEHTIERKRGGGQPLDAAVKTNMGKAMNADFSGVRVHTDMESDGLNRSLQARAFTTGRDVYFRQGEYNPSSSSGRQLLAHELTHVMQQGGSAVQSRNEKENNESACSGCAANNTIGTLQTKLTLGAPNDLYEQEADSVAKEYINWERQPVAKDNTRSQVRRQEGEEEKKEQMMQTKADASQLLRQPEEDNEKEPLQAKLADDSLRQQPEKEEEKPLQAKLVTGLVQRRGDSLSYGVNLSAPGHGQPLLNPVKAKMETALGDDFSDVRVHTDGMAERIGAVAFTSGNNLHFANGQYNPSSKSGQALLGHELTHVVQQREGRVQTTAIGSGHVVVDDPELEQEADRLGAAAADSTSVNPSVGDIYRSSGNNPTRGSISVVQGIHPALVTIGASLKTLTAADAAAVVGAVIGTGAAAAAAGNAIQPGQTGVQEVQLVNDWMSNRDKRRLELIVQYRLINAYVDQWIRAHGGAGATAPAPGSSASSVATGAAPGHSTTPTQNPGTSNGTQPKTHIDTSILNTVKSAVQLKLIEDLNASQLDQIVPYEFIWSDSGAHTADWFGTVGSISFVGLRSSYLIESLRLNHTASQISNLAPAHQGETYEVRQLRGGRMVRGSQMETGLNDSLGINLVGGGPTINQAGNDEHGVHTYDTAWNWDDNTTHWAFDVKVDNATGWPVVTAQSSRGTPED